jgi:hypothetical protein
MYISIYNIYYALPLRKILWKVYTNYLPETYSDSLELIRLSKLLNSVGRLLISKQARHQLTWHKKMQIQLTQMAQNSKNKTNEKKTIGWINDLHLLSEQFVWMHRWELKRTFIYVKDEQMKNFRDAFLMCCRCSCYIRLHNHRWWRCCLLFLFWTVICIMSGFSHWAHGFLNQQLSSVCPIPALTKILWQ